MAKICHVCVMAGHGLTCVCNHTDVKPVPFGESIEVKPGLKYETDSDLMSQDSFHMSQRMGTNVDLMFRTFSKDNMKYLIVVNTDTGESVEITFK